jgi:ABC-2 type transport system permease protein
VVELASMYRRLIGARIRADWQYRLSFTLFSAAQFFITVLDFIAITVIFHNVPRLAGWSLAEVAFLYGTSSVAFGLSDVFVSPVDRCSLYIKQGTFDQLLVRPLGPLFQLLTREFELRRVGKPLQALIVLVVAIARVPVEWTPARMMMTVVMVAAGTVIFSSLWVLTSATTFWTVDTQEMANAFTSGGNYLTQYPVDVYGEWLRRVLLIVPLAFVNYLPAVWILGRDDALGLPAVTQFASPVAAALLAVVAALVWRTAIRHYRSTGS